MDRQSHTCSGWGRRSGGWHRFTSSTPLITYVASFTRADRVVRAVAGQRELHVFCNRSTLLLSVACSVVTIYEPI